MTLRRHLLISTMLICLITSCGTSLPATPLPATAPLASPLPATPATLSMLPNTLVMAEGQVTVKRRETTGFVPAGVGAQVEPGDLLRVEGGEAAIFCGNETLWDSSPLVLTGGESHGVPCLAGRSPRPFPSLSRLRESLLRGETGSRVENISYVLSPRSGFVRSDRPTLRWHTLANTDVYTVTLTGDDELERPPVQTSGGELAYPDAWPSLAGGGASYSLVVQAGERSSEEDGSGAKSWGFSLLDPAQAAQLQSQEAKLRARPLGEDALTLLLAELYLSDAYRLRSEAAELLSGATVENLASAQVLLGELYLEMGLADESQPAFDQALMLARQAGLPEFEAGAAFGLGTVACLRQKQSEAEGYWQAAQTQYKALGMALQAQTAADRLSAAQTECN